MTPQEAQDMLHYAGADGFTAPELCLTAELAAHAPIMAEQIANQQYEYAVQRWTDGVGWETVCVRDTYEKVEALTYLWRDDMYRVARRLVGEWEHAPEVVE